MNVRAGLVLALFGAVALTGCYDFEAPIDPSPTIPLDPALLGSWQCLAPGQRADEKPATIAFDRAEREDSYSVLFDETSSNRSRIEAHGSAVAGHTLLNVFDPTESSQPWKLVRYSFLMPQVLRLELVDDDALAGVEQTPGALREALHQRDGSPDLYDDFCVCVRVKAEDGATPDAAQ